MDLKGDLNVARKIEVGRRIDQGLLNINNISAAFTVTPNSHYWLRISTDGIGDKDVNLPDPATVPEGFQVVIQNTSTSNNLNIKNNSAVLQKQAISGLSYSLTLVDAVNDKWLVNYLEDADIVVAARYIYNFLTTDFGAATGGYRELTLAAATHGRGSSPVIMLYEIVGTDLIKVEADRILVNSSGDVTLRVTAGDAESTDTEAVFNGRMVLV